MKALPLLRRWWSAPFVRVAVWGALGLAAFAGGLLLAYELALARVPQHRATLERLVRAQTGLDVRFNELNLRWGWYGPEAVFQRVELGEPGRANVLLRAPQLIVGFDAWRSVRSGQLQAGRITLIAPDINLERRTGAAPGESGALQSAHQLNTRLLQRWRGGRIEIEGGLLRLPDPGGSADALALQIRRVSLRHSSDQWSAAALVFLPERLGQTARLAAQLEGDPTRPRSMSGSVRFDGLRLAFAGWRQALGANSRIARQLPATGDGDVSFRVSFTGGQIEKADGHVRAQEVSFTTAPWFLNQGQAPQLTALALPRLRGDWRLAHRATGWQLRIEELDLGAKDSDARPGVSLDVGRGGHQVRGAIGDAPLESLAAIASWLAPQIDLSAVELKGLARDVKFDWNDTRLEGERLQATARGDSLSFAPPSRNFTLSGLTARLSADEGGIDITLNADHGRLIKADASDHPLEDLHIASDLRLSRQANGWHLNTPLMTVDYGPAELILSGSLTSAVPPAAPLLDVRATLVRAEIPMLQELLREAATQHFGEVAAKFTAGHIERAQFQLQTPLETPQASQPSARTGLFSGSLALREGQIAAGEWWPEVQGLDAQLEWTADHMTAQVDKGHAGSIELVSAQAEWQVKGPRAPRISGEVRGRLEEALPWLAAHPGLEEYIPQLRNFAATGEALFNFDIALPAAVRVAVLLDGAGLRLTEDLPPIQSVRGSLAFDKGRLQRSTLTASWLGGPLTLRVSERRERGASTLAIQAQGLLDAQELIALTGFDPLPEVTGQTPWSGGFTYQPEAAGHPARWQLEADASLVGVGSRLPEPLAKSVVTSLPLRVQASGSGAEAEMRISLADRLRSQLALVRVPQGRENSEARWRVERGAVHFGSGAATIPSEPLIAVQGEVNRFDFPAYASLWQRAGNLVKLPAIVADLIAEQLWLADRMFPVVRVQARKAVGTPSELSLESPALNGSVRWPASRVEVHLTAQNLDAAERARIVTHLQDSWKDPIVTVN